MASRPEDALITTSLGHEDATILDDVSDLSPTVVKNRSLTPDDCVAVMFSKMAFIPWNNPDNLISVQTETMVRHVKDCLLVLLFLIGGPANVINMAVFYRQGLRDRVNLCLCVLSLVDALFLMAQVLLHGEQMVLKFTTKEQFGPFTKFLANNNLIVVMSLCYISPILSTIIAIERCLCVFNPLKFQTLLRTRTMAAIILAVCASVSSVYFIVVYRFHIGCIFDPVSGVSVNTLVEGEFYKAHKELINHLDSYLLGVGLPGVLMIVVTTTTVMTIVKLRRIMTWRAETSSSLSPREVALTRMLVGNSILFVACTSPIALIRFLFIFFPEINSGRRNHNLFLTGVWTCEMFTFINATFNFVVYYIMGTRYRETLWELFSRKTPPAKSKS